MFLMLKKKELGFMDSFFFTCHTVCTQSRCQLLCEPGCRFRGGAGKAESGRGTRRPDWLTICLWDRADVWVHRATSSLLPGALAHPFVCVWWKFPSAHWYSVFFVCLILYVTEVDSGPTGADCPPYGVSHCRRGLCGNEGRAFHQPVWG